MQLDSRGGNPSSTSMNFDIYEERATRFAKRKISEFNTTLSLRVKALESRENLTGPDRRDSHVLNHWQGLLAP